MWGVGTNGLQNPGVRAVVVFMMMLMERPGVLETAAATPATPDGAFEEIMRRATGGALVRESRLEIGFDRITGSYRLGVSTATF
jgi:hypothetical protein